MKQRNSNLISAHLVREMPHLDVARTWPLQRPGAPPLRDTAPQSVAAVPAATLPKLRLASWLQRVSHAIRDHVPAEAWVEAEVREVHVKQHRIEFTLTEASDGNVQRDGMLKVTINMKALPAILARFPPGFDLRALTGQSGRLLLRSSFHPHYHLGGDILDIDPLWIPGTLAEEKAYLRHLLVQEGIFDAQKRLPSPSDIFNLAVIHPFNGASLGDVHQELKVWETAGILSFTSIPAIFEGSYAAVSLVEAIKKVSASCSGSTNFPDSNPPFDLALIIRGGGNPASLSFLDDAQIARALCLCPVPVITGLGHAKDRSILDEIAWRSADTPSKAIALVHEIFRNVLHEADGNLAAIASSVKSRLASASTALKFQASRYARQARRHLRVHMNNVALTHAALETGVAMRLQALERMGKDLASSHKKLFGGKAMAGFAAKANIQVQASDPCPVAKAGDMVHSTPGNKFREPVLASDERLAASRKDIDFLALRISASVNRRLAAATGAIDLWIQVVRNLEEHLPSLPGYPVVAAPDGTHVITALKAAKLDTLILQFRDGKLAVRPDAHPLASQQKKENK